MPSLLTTRIDLLARDIHARNTVLARDLKILTIGLIVLYTLYQEDGQTASMLARASARAVNSFTPILDNLEKRGLICRRSHLTDRRAIRVFLTPAGRFIQKRVTDHIENLEAELVTVMLSRLNNAHVPAGFLVNLFAPLPPAKP